MSDSVASNVVALVVAERLDAQLTVATGPTLHLDPGDTAVAVILTNTGNGAEAYQVSATVKADGAQVRTVALDSNGNGRFDPGIDQPIAAGETPQLEPGTSLTVLVVVDAATAPSDATLTVTARAATGSGDPGQVFAGAGEGGGDAVTGTSGGAATIVLTTAPVHAPTLVKSQAVLAPDGSGTAISGATVTYRLAASFPDAAFAVRITDPIPAGTRYVPGSLSLDDRPMSDAADDDAGTGSADGIAVALGDVPPAATHVVQFKVTIP